MMVLTRNVISSKVNKNEWLGEFETLLLEIESNVDDKPDMCIGSCKSLLESIAKNILIRLDVTYKEEEAKKKDVQLLVKLANEKILEKDVENEEEFLKRFTPVIQRINEIRNERFEVAHGKLLPIEKRSSVQFAKTIKSFTDGFASYLLYLFLSIDFSYQEPLKYEDNQEFNEKLDEANHIDGRLLYSKALFDQDINAYQYELDTYNDVKNSLIEQLEKCGTFAYTHSVIQELSGYSSWSDEQIIELLKAAESNNQVHWIIKDDDIQTFYKTILADKVEKMFELEELHSILERIGYDNPLQDNSDETE